MTSQLEVLAWFFGIIIGAVWAITPFAVWRLLGEVQRLRADLKKWHDGG